MLLGVYTYSLLLYPITMPRIPRATTNPARISSVKSTLILIIVLLRYTKGSFGPFVHCGIIMNDLFPIIPRTFSGLDTKLLEFAFVCFQEVVRHLERADNLAFFGVWVHDLIPIIHTWINKSRTKCRGGYFFLRDVKGGNYLACGYSLRP